MRHAVNYRSSVRVCGVAVVALLAMACAHAPAGSSRYGRVAFYTDEVVKKVDLVLTTVDILGDQKVLTPEQVTRVAKVAKEIGVQAGNIQKALVILQSPSGDSGAKSSALVAVQDALTKIQRIVAEGLLPKDIPQSAINILTDKVFPLADLVLSMAQALGSAA